MEFITPCYSTSSVQDNLLFILRELSISLSMLPMLGSAPKKIISELQYLINYLSFLTMEKNTRVKGVNSYYNNLTFERPNLNLEFK